MKTCSVCTIEKPLADFHPKKGGRFGVSSTCRPCANAKSKAYHAANAETQRTKNKAFREANREKLAARSRADYAANREARRATQRAYYQKNIEAFALRNADWRARNTDWSKRYEKARSAERVAYNALYRAKNPEKWKAYSAEYARFRSRNEKRAQPKWAKPEAIKSFYMLAQILTEETEEPHHVDHVIPLKGKTVSGLHVETNLQILTASDNLAKSNSFEGGW